MSKRFSNLSGSLRQSTQKWLLGLAPLAFALSGGLGMLPAEAVEFPQTGDRGAPGRTAGGGTRGGWCENMEWSDSWVRALVPDNNVNTFADAEAALWVDVSEMFNGMPAELYVQNAETHERVHLQTMQLADLETNSLVKMNLPAEDALGAPLLEVGQDYYWEFSIICDANDRTRDYIISGLFHRMETPDDLTEALAATNQPEAQAMLYAEAELWQETLETVAAVSAEQPELWDSLMHSVGLDEIEAGYADYTDPASDQPTQLTSFRLTETDLPMNR